MSDQPTDHWIELRHGTPLAPAQVLNRIARQQGLNQAIAQALILDEIHQTIPLATAFENGLIAHFLEEQGVHDDAQLERYLIRQGWDQDDLRYIATKGYRLALFKKRMFREELEIRFLERKLDFDQVEYSLLRTRDENLAFELHQRLLEGEASFEELAPLYAEGPERESGGRCGPVPLSLAHPEVAEKLRISQPGQLWPPIFLVNIWLILRLDRRIGAQLDEERSADLLNELFTDWLRPRVDQLLKGETPAALPLTLLEDAASPNGAQTTGSEA